MDENEDRGQLQGDVLLVCIPAKVDDKSLGLLFGDCDDPCDQADNRGGRE
jgi:hypothetical protein